MYVGKIIAGEPWLSQEKSKSLAKLTRLSARPISLLTSSQDIAGSKMEALRSTRGMCGSTMWILEVIQLNMSQSSDSLILPTPEYHSSSPHFLNRCIFGMTDVVITRDSPD
jgi:hypothetical protein